MPDPRPLVVEVEWQQDGEARREMYGPWTPAEGDSHLAAIKRFVTGWHDKSGITPEAVRLWLCVDPEEWLAGKAVSSARVVHPDSETGT